MRDDDDERTLVDRRRPKSVNKALRVVEFLYDYYFRCEVEGIENVPCDRAILFGNHCGSSYTMESAMLTVALLRHHGADHKLYYLAHKNFFDIPGLRERLLATGVVPGTREIATKILEENGQFVTFPGGDRDSHKPFSERHRINFFGHTGFIRIAINTRTPLVPFVHVGTHNTMFVLSSGTGIVDAFDLRRRLGLNVFPVILSFPFGLTVGPYFPAIPLPAKIRMRVLPPILPWEMGWDDAEDAHGREECLRYVTMRCQEALIKLRDNP